MIVLREGMNIESKLNQVKSIDLVIKENLSNKEHINTEIVTPKLKYSTPEVDLDLPTHICLEGKDLDNVALTTSLLKHQIDVVMLNTPTGYDSDPFYYNGEMIKPGSAFYKSKLMYWLHNRIKLAHEMLDPAGTMIVSVTEEWLAETTLLLNSIFGENNKIITHVVITNRAARVKSGVSTQHQYVLVYAVDIDMCLEKNAKNIGKNRYFSVPKTIKNGENSFKNQPVSARKYNNNGDSCDLASYIRSSNRRCNDANFYPVYYLPAKTFTDDGVDWSPRLSLSPTELAGEVVIYPITESGKECIWNNNRTSCQTKINNKELAIKSINGKYKLFYKIRDDLDEFGTSIEPVKSILDNMSNAAASRRMKEVLGTDETCLGFHYDLVKYLLTAYSQNGDKVVTINDSNWSTLIGILEHNLERTIYHLIPEQLPKPEETLSLLQSTYKSQIMLYETVQCANECSLQFVDDNKAKQKDFITYQVGPTATLLDTKFYTIHETSNYELIVDIHNFYDAEIYTKLNKDINSLLNDNSNRVLVYYIEDSEHSLGNTFIQCGIFKNILIYYRTNWNTTRNLVI